MPANTSRGYPYMLDTDPLADVAERIQALAVAIDTRLVRQIHAGSKNVTVAAGSATQADTFTFPVGKFTQPPFVIPVIRGTSFYAIGISAPSAASCAFTVRHLDGTVAPAGGTSLAVDYIAIQL